MVSRKVWLSVVLATFVALSGSSVSAQRPDSGDAGVSAAVLPATAPWFGQRVDRNAVGYGDDRGQHVSVAFLGGTPYVSYYDATNTSLRVAWPVTSGGNCGPGNSWHCETVDDSGDVGLYSSIAAMIGTFGSRVGIAYYDATSTKRVLKLAERTCTLGTCTWNIVTIQSLSNVSVGTFASLRYDSSGGRHIAYRGVPLLGSTSLRYAHSVPGGGNCGTGGAAEYWQCDIIDSGIGIGRYSSLDLNGAGQPRIAYYDDGNNILKYAEKGGAGGNCGPGNTWVCRGIDPVTDAGRFASLSVSKGSPEKAHIAYYNATTGKLRYATYVGSGGNCGLNSITSQYEWKCDNISDMGAGLTQAGVSLALDSSGRPFIAYQDASSALGPAHLAIARPVVTLGHLGGNCGPMTALLTHSWKCDLLDSGGSYTDEARYVALAMNSAGLGTIAYYESDSYYMTGYLKVMAQRLQAFLPIVQKQ